MNDQSAEVEKTEVRTIGIAGAEFQIDAPFGEGHVLTAAEARVINQTYGENIRNNLREQVKEALEKGQTVDQIQTDIVDKYCQEYEFGARKGGGGPRLDPVMREMRNIAAESLKVAVAKANGNWNKLSAEEKDKLYEKFFAKYGDQTRATAERRIAELKQSQTSVEIEL